MRAGEFVAELHAALPRHADGTVSLHGDLAPWNVLVDGNRWSAIDWDSTHRGEPLWEVAYCLLTLDGELAGALAMVDDRCLEVVRFVRQRAAEGVPGFVRLLAEGHDAMWRRNAEYPASQRPAWLDALAP